MNINSVISSSKGLINSSKSKVVSTAAKPLRAVGQTFSESALVTRSRSLYDNILVMLKNVADSSPVIKSVTETVSEVGKNIRQSCVHSKLEGESVVSGAFRGLKNSKAVIKKSCRDISGVSDIVLAKKELGTKAAFIEAGKSSIRLLVSSSMSAACLPIPIPGAFIGGWVAGEKLVEKVLGKSISKKI